MTLWPKHLACIGVNHFNILHDVTCKTDILRLASYRVATSNDYTRGALFKQHAKLGSWWTIYNFTIEPTAATLGQYT